MSFATSRDLVHVCLPTRNGEEHLSEALESLLHQSHQEIEILICDNASTDRTPDIARAYTARDQRVRYCRWEEFVCATGNWNRAFSQIDRSRARFFMWASDDDVWSRDFIQVLLRRLKQSPNAVLSFCNYRQIDKQSAVVTEDRFGPLEWKSRSPLDTYMWLMRRDCGHCAFYGIMRLDALTWEPVLQDCTFGCDLLFLIRLAAKGDFIYYPAPLWSKRLGGISATGADASAPLDEALIWNIGNDEWSLIRELNAPVYSKCYIYWSLKVFGKLYLPSKKISAFLWPWYAAIALRRNTRALGIRSRLRGMLASVRGGS